MKISGKSLYKKQLKELQKIPSYRELLKTKHKIENRKKLCQENIIKLLGITQEMLPLMEKAGDWLTDLSIHNLMSCDGYHVQNYQLNSKNFSVWFATEELKTKTLENFEIISRKEKCQQIDILLTKINFILKEKDNIV